MKAIRFDVVFFYKQTYNIVMSRANNKSLLAQINSFFAKRSKTMSTIANSSKKFPLQVSNLSNHDKSTQNQEKQIVLEKYEGEPILRSYLQSTHSNSNDQRIAEPSLSNRNMGKLAKRCLPKLIYLYQENGHSFQNLEVQLVHEKKFKDNELKIKLPPNSSSKSANTRQLDQTNCLLVGQTIIFTKLSYEKFKNLFDKDGETTHKILQKLKSLNQDGINHRKQQIENFMQVLFRLFCLPEMDCILWPSILLQPILGTKQKAKKIISISKHSTQKCEITQEIFQDTLKQYLLNVMVDKTTPDTFKPTKQEKICLSNITQILNKQTYNPQEFIVKLIGTNITIVESQLFYEWNEFSCHQLSLIVNRTPFQLLLPSINRVIETFNTFKKMEHCEVTDNECLYKLCKFKSQTHEQVCIPVRCIVKQSHNVLIRCLGPNNLPFNQQLKLVKSSELTVNQTLPTHCLEQRKFYHFFSLNFSVQQVLNYIYNSFMGKNTESYLHVFRITYPLNEIQRRLAAQSRCLKCNYLVRQEQYLCCKFCLQKYHLSCTQEKNSKRYAKNIYLTQNDKDLWCCQECSPCNTCYQSISDLKNALKCRMCSGMYHFNCGIIEDNRQLLKKQTNFVCENCLKCSLCKIPLKGKQHFAEKSMALCVACLRNQYMNNCVSCNQKTTYEDGIQCQNDHCQQWVHISCAEKDKLNAKKNIFKCDECRRGQKRKVIKWVIQELRIFDEYEYFDDPVHEYVAQYQTIVKNPMCFTFMRSKNLSGEYDNNTYQKIYSDIKLIAYNAMIYNMPREHIHFRARVLMVIGEWFLQTMKSLLNFNSFQIMTQQLDQLFLNLKSNFYKELYKRFPGYLLNYGKKQSRIQITTGKEIEQNDCVFFLRDILIKGLSNCQIKYHIALKPETVDHLFKVPKLGSATWTKIAQNRCYYHPAQQLPVIFQCKICWETYCCTKRCFKHIFCLLCKKNGCSCNNSDCKCPPLREYESKYLEKQVKPILKANAISKLEYTEYHKYCLRCAKQMQRNCFVCSKLCYYGYEQCKQCKAVYHLSCENKKKANKFESPGIRANQQEGGSNVRLSNLCTKCERSIKYLPQYRHQVLKQINQTKNKHKQIHHHLYFFKKVYEENHLRLSDRAIISIILRNYNQYNNRLMFFDRLLALKQSLPVPIQQVKIQSLRFEDIMISKMQPLSKMHPYMPLNYNDQLQIYSCNLKRRLDKIDFSFKYTLLKTKSQRSYYCRFQELIRATIVESLAPSKENKICSTNGQYRPYDYLKCIQIAKEFNLIFYPNQEQFYCFFDQPDYLLPSPYKNISQNLPENRSLFCRQSSRKSILAFKHYEPLYQPFQSELQKQKTASILPKECYIKPKPKSSNQIYNFLNDYLTNFAIKMLNEERIVLRKGNTYIISPNPNDWIVYKKLLDIGYTIRLTKQQKSYLWTLSINENAYHVEGITQISTILKSLGAQVNTFEQIYEFMGFSFDATQSVPRHFSKFFHHKETYELQPKNRAKEVLKIYDEYQWLQNGIVQHKATKKITKVKRQKLYYLSKRKQALADDQDTEAQNGQSKPFISLQELTRQIFPKSSQPELLQQLQISLHPINDVYIAPSKIDRLGLFLGQSVSKYTTLIEYVGQIVSESIADLRQSQYKDGCYMFTIHQHQNQNDRLEIIDATQFGNKARYLNHSCDPNCRAKVVSIQGKSKILIYTIKDVQKDQELTYDYQFKIESEVKLQCKCGSKICQGRLN